MDNEQHNNPNQWEEESYDTLDRAEDKAKAGWDKLKGEARDQYSDLKESMDTDDSNK